MRTTPKTGTADEADPSRPERVRRAGGYGSVVGMEIEIGCRFAFDVAHPTHAVMLVEPHPDEDPRVA